MLCPERAETREKIGVEMLGREKGGGEKIPEKERELGKQMSAVCQDLCVGVKATGRRAAWLRATLTFPRAVPHDLGWVLHHVLFSW